MYDAVSLSGFRIGLALGQDEGCGQAFSTEGQDEGNVLYTDV